MNLEKMLARIQEIENAIVSTTNQLNTLLGHKNEAQYWIALLKEQEQNSTSAEESIESVEEVSL